MKADMDDMPEYLKTRKQESPWRMVVIIGIGTTVVVGAIGLFGGGFAERAQRIANGQSLSDDIGFMQPQPKQQERTRPQGVAATQQSYNPARTLRNEEPLIIEKGRAFEPASDQSEKQTVFNDQNYRPQGAVNVVSFNTPTSYNEPQRSNQSRQQEIVIIGQETKPGDWVCNYFGGKGSIERRNCKSNMQLHNRNQNYSGNRNP